MFLTQCACIYNTELMLVLKYILFVCNNRKCTIYDNDDSEEYTVYIVYITR